MAPLKFFWQKVVLGVGLVDHWPATLLEKPLLFAYSEGLVSQGSFLTECPGGREERYHFGQRCLRKTDAGMPASNVLIPATKSGLSQNSPKHT
jgi:hypothetical protein